MLNATTMAQNQENCIHFLRSILSHWGDMILMNHSEENISVTKKIQLNISCEVMLTVERIWYMLMIYLMVNIIEVVCKILRCMWQKPSFSLYCWSKDTILELSLHKTWRELYCVIALLWYWGIRKQIPYSGIIFQSVTIMKKKLYSNPIIWKKVQKGGKAKIRYIW